VTRASPVELRSLVRDIWLPIPQCGLRPSTLRASQPSESSSPCSDRGSNSQKLPSNAAIEKHNHDNILAICAASLCPCHPQDFRISGLQIIPISPAPLCRLYKFSTYCHRNPSNPSVEVRHMSPDQNAWCPRFASALCELTWGGTTRVVRPTRTFRPGGAPKSRRRGKERVTQGANLGHQAVAIVRNSHAWFPSRPSNPLLSVLLGSPIHLP